MSRDSRPDGLVGDVSATGFGVNEVHVNDLIECLASYGIFSVFLDLSLPQAVQQVRFLSVLDFEIVLDHGVSQPVQGFQLGGTQHGFCGKIFVEREF